MHVRVLGDLELERDGRLLALGGPKPRALLGLLVAARGRPVAVDRLVDQLWGDDPPAKALGALQAYVSKLRRELEQIPSEPTVLVTRPSGYALVLPDDAVDAYDVERALEAPAGADAERLLVTALGRWRGPAYADLRSVPALDTEGRRLDELRIAAQERLWSARLEHGPADKAVAPLQALAAEHPTRERLAALLVRALYRSGRQADALDALRRARRRLADELGIDPGPELQELEQSVLRQDAALLPAAATGTSRTPVALPGRTRVLERAATLAAEAAAGRGRLMIVTGPPGIGKTRVAEAIGGVAAGHGLRPVRGAWDAEGCPPLWGWTRVLGPGSEQALSHAVDAEDDVGSSAFRLAEVARERLAAGGGACVLLDDVQWADEDSRRLLVRLAATVSDLPVVLVVLCREPVPGTVSGTLAALARLGADRTVLAGLDAEDVRTVVHHQTGVPADAAVAERIVARTGGNPFAVLELVRMLAAEDALVDLDSPAWSLVPHGVRDTVRHHLDEVPQPTRDVLTAAAVVGGTVDLGVLEQILDAGPRDLDAATGAALAAGLLVEDVPGRVRFAHGLVRDAVYADIAPYARRELHARTAAGVERLHVGQLDAYAATLAEHYRAAGPTHARSAWSYALRAASRSAATGAHADAANRLASAVELQDQDLLVDASDREQVLVAWGTALRRSGRMVEAWAPLQRAADSAMSRGDAQAAADALLVVTERVLWSWRTAHHADDDAVALWQRVVEALPADDLGRRAQCLAALAVEVMHDPPGGRCGEWVDEAFDLARRDGRPDVRIRVLHTALNPLRRPDLLPRRVPAADELVELCARFGDERALAVALGKRALNHSTFGRPADAVADLVRARTLAERHRLAPALMIIDYGLAVLRQAQGDLGASETALQAALSAQSTLTMAGSGMASVLRSTALYPQGRLGEAETVLRDAARVHPGLRELHGLALVEAGRTAEARVALGAWREQPALTWDYLWLTNTVARALLWARLGDAEAIADLRVALRPYADRIADGAMAAAFLGSVEHALAVLALAAGDRGEGRRRAEAAVELHRRLGWTPWQHLSQQLLERAVDAG